MIDYIFVPVCHVLVVQHQSQCNDLGWYGIT